jgi:uncharacterized membrane protein
MSAEEMTPEESAEEVKGVPEEEPAPESLAEAEPEVQEDLAAEMEEVLETAAAPSGAWPAKDTTDNDRLMAGLAYASQVVIPLIVPAVMLLAEESKERPFQRYHAIQSLGFLVIAVIYEVLAAIVFCGLSAVTSGCLACVLWVLFVLPAIPAFYYAYQAYQGFYFKIPFLTDFLVDNKWLEIPAE